MTPKTTPALLVGIIIVSSVVSCARSDESAGVQIVKMTTGSYKTVADGRAEIWIGIFDNQWREDLEKLAETVEVEIRCGEDQRIVWVFADRPTEEVCGIQLQLEEVTTWRPPEARIRVIWESP